MNRLSKIELAGFKSIRTMDPLNLGKLTVLIGANGSGKSNFASLFSMLNFAMTGALQYWIGERGGADGLLHYGAKTTPQMTLDLEYETEDGVNRYHARLVHAAPDTLMFGDETVSFKRHDAQLEPEPISLGSGHKESAIPEAGRAGNQTAAAAFGCMSRWRFYQFHDTSATAGMRQSRDIEDNRYLRSDAGNLAAFLHGLRETDSAAYQRILGTVRLAAPFLNDFDLDPLVRNPKRVMLNWTERGRDHLFGPHHLSDGTLRFIALTALLQQPESRLPSAIIIDEPELGLHPYATSLLGSMIRSLPDDTQVVLATQSVLLVDEFEPEDIVVVERHEGETTFRRQSSDELADWLEEYTIGELWEKNVTGGRPSR